VVEVAGVVALGARCIARPPRRVERPQGRSTSPGSAPRGRGFYARCHDQMKKPPLRVACSFGGGGGSCCPGRALHRAPASPGRTSAGTFDKSRLSPAWTRVSCSLPRPNEKATATGGLFIWWRWRELLPWARAASRARLAGSNVRRDVRQIPARPRVDAGFMLIATTK
jgi:hypothetical protein